MINTNSVELREWAARCEEMAASTTDAKERASLLRKCEALRALADSEDLLAGLPSVSGSNPANKPDRLAVKPAQAAE